MKATISCVRSGDAVTATWSAPARYAYIWAACTAPGYEKWVAVRAEGWEDPVLEWAGVPADATVALMAPQMRGEQRTWRTLATTSV